MDTDAVQRRILVVIGSAVGITLLARMIARPSETIRKPGSVVRIVAGGFGASIGLMALGSAHADLATMLAYLILLGTVYTYAEPVLTKYTKPLNTEFKVVDISDYKASKKMTKKGS